MPLDENGERSTARGFSLSIFRRVFSTTRCKQRLLQLTGPKNLFDVFKIVVVIGILGTGVLYYVTSDWPVIIEDTKYGRLTNKKVDSSKYILEVKCSSMVSDCYIVADAADVARNTAYRGLTIQGFEDDFETLVPLIPPKGANVTESDTRIWKLDHLKLKMQYTATMVVAPFATASLSIDKGSKLDADILIVGLGGGSMNMFLRKTFPEMHITSVELDPVVVGLAKTWFGVVEDDHHQILIEDGKDFILKSAEKGKKFDVIVIDACGSDKVLSCPVRKLMDRKVLEAIAKQLLKPFGTVVINILPLQPNDKKEKSVIASVQEHFPTCLRAQLTLEMNSILACIPLRLDDAINSQKMFAKQLQRAWIYFKFNESLGDVTMNMAVCLTVPHLAALLLSISSLAVVGIRVIVYFFVF